MRVVLLGMPGEDLEPPPGRDLLVGPRHTFAQLAEAIDSAFARWEPHEHEFTLADGRRIAPVYEEDEDSLDDARETFASLGLRAHARFGYVFDLGDEWRHAAEILRDDVRPKEECGATPTRITPVFGWGAIPDQYGRRTPDDEGEDQDDAER